MPTPTARERRIRAAEWADSYSRDVLRGLAQEAPAAFDAFLDWIGDGKRRGDGSRFILTGYSDLAKANEPAALRVLRMPFLQEVEYPDSQVVVLLRDLARSDPEGLVLLLDHSTLEGGIADDQVGDVFLLHLERTDAAAVDRLRRLSWVEDGLTRGAWGETEVVIDLVQTALVFPGTFDALLLRTWMHDGVTGPEGQVVNRISQVGASPFNDDEMRPLVGMPFLGAVDEIDSWLVSVLLETLSRSAYGVRDIIARPEVQGGITDAGRSTVGLLVLDLYNREAADRLRALPWLRDGLQHGERRVFVTLWDQARHDAAGGVFRLLMSRSWVRDDITPLETDVVDALMGICYASEDCSTELPRVMSMPFLDTVEPEDLDALRALRP